MAGGYVDKKENVVNMLKQQEGVASNQVMLRVRFAEVSRSAMQELGVSMFANGAGGSDEWYRPFGASAVPAPTFDDGKLVFSDFLNLFVFNSKENLGARRQGALEQGSLPEPGGAEPDRHQRQGSQLPRRRRVSLPGRAVRLGHELGDHHLQGVRRPSELHADRARRRPDQPQGQARSQLARLRERGHHRWLPRAGAVDPPHRDRSRAARRTDVRHRRSDEQHADEHDGQDPGHRRHPDPRPAVQEQGAPEEPDRARRHDHAVDL